MGTERILKPLFSKYLKKKVIYGFDIETFGKNNDFYMGGIYSTDGFIYFYDKEEFIKELMKPKYFGNCFLVATNLEFDFVGLYYNTQFWNEFKILMRGGRYIACTKRNRKNQKSVYIDTLNYVMRGLSVLGKIIGVPKLNTPACILNINIGVPFIPHDPKIFDWDDIELKNLSRGYARKPYNEAEEKELLIYNKRDCEITFKFMEFLQDGVNELGAKLQLTSASTSLDLYRRKYLRKTLYKEDYVLNTPDGESINDFIFEGYFGGRTEVFKRGFAPKIPIKDANGKIIDYKKISGWDINSLYPSVMRNNYPHPNSAKVIEENTQEYIDKYEGVSKVDVYCPYMRYPLLPLKHDGKLVFPVGKFSGVYNHVELRRFKELGGKILRVYKTLYYKYNHKPFVDYVNDLYDLRLKYKKEKNPNQEVIKLFLNSLYGKFGSKKFNETHIFDIDYLEEDEFNEWFNGNKPDYTKYTRDNKKFILNKEIPVNKPYQIPIYASYTTSYARILMHNHILELQERGEDPLYMDTDSLFTYGEMQTDKALGKMSLDYECDQAIFIKPKMYMYNKGEEYFCKIKGVSRVDKEKFFAVMRGESVTYESFMKTKSGIRRGIAPNSIVQNTKSLNLEDNKRIWKSEFDPETLQESDPIEVNLL